MLFKKHVHLTLGDGRSFDLLLLVSSEVSIPLLSPDTVPSGGPRWLRCCVTNRKVAGLIPAEVGEFFIDIKSFRSHYGPGVDSAFNINEYQQYFLGVKAAGA